MECVDCGAPTAGERCKAHASRQRALYEANRLAVSDRELIGLSEAGISPTRLAVRYGRSRQRMYQKLADARRRQRLLDTGEWERGPGKRKGKRT